MTEEKRPGLGPVLLTVLLDLLGFGLVIPLLSFYAESFDASPVQVTGLMASYSIAQFVFAPMWGSLSDRVGRRPVMLASITGTVIFLSAFASATSLWQLFLFRTLHGACAANIGAAQAYVADVTTPETRARGMGLIGASFGVGFTLGPMVGGILSPYSLTAPIWLAAGLSAVNLVWALVRLPESRKPGEVSGHHGRVLDPLVILEVLRHPIVGGVIFLAFSATFAFAMLESTFALVAEHTWSMDARTVGLLFGLIGIIGIVIQGGLIGRLVKRFGERPLLATGYACTASGMVLLSFTHEGGAWFANGWGPIVIGCILLAIGTSLSNPSMTSLVSRSTDAEEQGRVLGVNQSLAALARAVAPTAGGFLYAHWFFGGAFAAGALIMGTSLLVAAPSVLRTPQRA
ncbi:MAG: MFS transporter [Myxococcales bacterium]|nr:MFS transporter [Myxococcales bacterium]